MRRLTLWVIAHPILALLIVAAMTAAALPGIPRLRIDASASGLLIPGSEPVRFYEEVRGTFGDDVILSLVLVTDDVFRPEILEAVRALTEEGAAVDGVSRVVSLATVNNLKGEDGLLVTDDLLQYVPTDGEELAQLRRDALGNELLLGEVVSRDGRATGVHLFLEARPEELGFEKRLVDEAEAMLDRQRAQLGEGVHLFQVGNPYLKQAVMEHIRGDLMVLAPACLVVILLLLWVVFRSFVAMLVPALTGVLSVVITLGFMGYAGIELTPVTVMIPSLLIVVGCVEDIHLIAEYAMELRAGLGREEALRRMAGKAGMAMLLCAVTTYLGFVTMVTNRIPMLRDFGLASSTGIAIGFVVTALIVPAVLRLVPAPARLAHAGEGVSFDWLKRILIGAAVNRPARVIALSALLLVVFLYGWTRMRVDTNYLSFFRESSEVQRLYRDVSENLVGALNFLVVVDTGEEGGAHEPRALADVAALADHLATRVDKVLSYPDYLRKLNVELHEGDREHWRVPESRELVSQLGLMLDPDDAERFVDFDGRRIAMLVRTSRTGSREIAELVEDIEGFASAKMSRDLDVTVTGESVLIAQASDRISIELMTSLSGVMVTIFALISLLFYSFKAGLLAMVPNVVPVLINFGFMGFTGIPLSMATFPVAVIALGISVDDTIHFMVRFSKELESTSDNERALKRTIIRELQPVLTSSVALILGFSTLLLGQFASTVQFGILAALSMASAVVADLFVTPVLLRTTPLITAWDILRLKISDQVMERSPLFQGLGRSEVKRVALLGEVKRHLAGDAILRQNDVGEDLIVLLKGEARIEARDEAGGRARELGTVGPGDVVGEMAFFTKGKRSASVIATTDGESLLVGAKRLERVEARFPRTAAKIHRNLSALLSRKLVQATGWLTNE